MKKVITEGDVLAAYTKGSKFLTVDKNVLITPLAKDKIKELNIILQKELPIVKEYKTKQNIIVVGCDHTGLQLKEVLKSILIEKSYGIIDVGTNDEKSCDYPDFAIAVAQKVIADEADFGIIVDATGIPSAITANKIPGIRAATCYNEFTAWSARNHNDANIMVLGAKAIGDETAKSILKKWLESEFEGGRHQKRLDKISALERKLLGNS